MTNRHHPHDTPGNNAFNQWGVVSRQSPTASTHRAVGVEDRLP